jgi:hypothetical protein
MRVLAMATVIGGLLSVSPTGAQTPGASPLQQADLHAGIGWAHVRTADRSPGEDWDHGVAQLAVGLGWYWTDHLKTEVELVAGSSAEFHRFERLDAGGTVAYRTSTLRQQEWGIGIAQAFQFFRNAWFHPHVAVGFDLRRASLEQRIDPVVRFDAAGRVLEIEPARVEGPRACFTARPYALTGFKAYVSRRAFFRSDLRAGFGTSDGDVVVRAGFGVDF